LTSGKEPLTAIERNRQRKKRKSAEKEEGKMVWVIKLKVFKE